MPSLTEQYQQLFHRFGSPLKRAHAVPAAVLDQAEQRLGHAIPHALRAYYEVAGRERRFNRSLQTFLSPAKWFVDQGRLAFLEENQSVCCWGVSLKSPGAEDPRIDQGVRHDDGIGWSKEHNKCSQFLAVILHYQAVSGGFPHCASGDAPKDIHLRLKREGWKYVGQCNQLWAFSRPNQAVCIMANESLPFLSAMMLMAGGKTPADLEAIGQSLRVKLDD